MTAYAIPPLLLALERETELMRAPGAWDPAPAFAALAAFDDPLSAIVALNAWRGAAPRGTAALIDRITPEWAARLGRVLCCWSMQLAVPGPLRTGVDEALALAWPTLSPAERDVAALRRG